MSRLIVWLMVAMLVGAYFIPSAAHAQAAQCQNATQCDQGQAYSACMSELSTYMAARTAAGEKLRNPTCPTASPTMYSSRFEVQLNGGAWQGGVYRSYYFSSTCAARLQGQAGMINGTLYSGGVCDKGCKVEPNLDPDTNFTLRESSNPNAISIRAGTWKPTGDVCGPDAPPTPPKNDEFCHTTSSGHKVCKSKDKTCVTTASGFRTCASDTANKTGHSATNNPRTEGIGIGAPDTPPNPPANRPGENWQQSGSTTNITNNNTGSTTNNSTYNNVGKANGNQPVPGDGSGPGAGGSNGNGSDGDGNGDDGSSDSASDSGNCTSPPQCIGDTLKCLQLNYTWKVQCNTKGAEVTGGEGCSDADVPVCAGTTCRAEAYSQLLQQWRQRCAAQSMADGMAARAGNISNPDDDGVVDDIWIKPTTGEGPKLRQDLISVGGAGPLLPSISLEGRSWEPPPQFYDAIAGVKFLVIAMCTVMAMFVVGRNI
jgi:hypothetical protein